MVELTKAEFDRYKPLNGNVIVEIDKVLHDTINGLYASNVEVEQKNRHGVKEGVVVKAASTNPAISFPIKQEVVVRKGDRVIFDYKVASEITDFLQHTGGQDSRLISCEGKLYLSVPYPFIYVRERDGQKHALNGQIIGKKIAKTGFMETGYYTDRMEVVLPTIPVANLTAPKIGETVYYEGTIVPLDSETINPETLYRISPFRIFATNEAV